MLWALADPLLSFTVMAMTNVFELAEPVEVYW
jgi:hypothetical protein